MASSLLFLALTVLIVTVILAPIAAGQAAAAGQGTNVNVSNTAGLSFSPRIVSTADGVYVVWQDLTPGLSDIYFASSTDGGSSFSDPINVSNTPDGDSSVPWIAVQGSNIYVVWQDTSPTGDVYFVFSSNAGANFSNPVNVSNQGTAAIPEVAVSGDSIYVTWVDFSSGNPDVYFASSTDSANFSEPTNVSNTPDGFSNLPQIAVSEGGTVYVVWQDNSPSDDIYFVSSENGGQNFTNPVNVSNTPDGSSFSPVLAISGDSVYVAWQDTFPSNDVYLVSSTDGGNSFDEPVNVSDNPDVSVNAALAVSNADPLKVFLAWSDSSGTEDGFLDIFYASSTDGGQSFSDPQNISDNAGTSSTPQIGVDDSDNVFISWADDIVDPSNGEILLATSLDDFTCAANISNNPSYSLQPLLAVSPADGLPSILWQDPIDPNDPGNSELIMRGSYDPSLPSITLDAVRLNYAETGLSNTPKWEVDSVQVSGSLVSPGNDDTVTVNWGDDSADTEIPISGCNWGPVSHEYSQSAVALNPIEVTADLVGSDGHTRTTSTSAEITVQKHLTQTTLDGISSNTTGSEIAISGQVVDSDTGLGVEGLTVSFDGTGADGIFDPVTTLADGTFSAAGIAPAAQDGLIVQAHFAGDESFLGSDSDIQTFDSISESATKFNVTAGSPSHVELAGFSFNASIDFEEAVSDGIVFVSECESPESTRYTSLEMCLQVSPAVDLAPGSGANVTMSFADKGLPQGSSADGVDIFHEQPDQSIVDITSARDKDGGTVTGTVSSFSKFVAGIALHDPEPEGVQRHQIYVGDGNLISFRDISVLDQNSSALAVASFDKQGYVMTDHPVLSITDSNGNIDSNKIDVIRAAVKSETSDPFVVEIELSETGPDTGIFTGSFGFTSGDSSSENGVLQANIGDKLSVNYISGARANVELDGVAESGIVQLSDYVVDEGVCLKPIGGAFNLDLVDAQLGPNGKIKVTISYANSVLRGYDPSSFRMVHREDATWIDITLPDPDGHDLDAMTVTGEASSAGPFSLAVDLDDCSGGAGGGLGRPGAGLVVDFVASIARPPSDSGGGGHHSGGGGGGGTPSTPVTPTPPGSSSSVPAGEGNEVVVPVSGGSGVEVTAVKLLFESVTSGGIVSVTTQELGSLANLFDSTVGSLATVGTNDANYTTVGTVYEIKPSTQLSFSGFVDVTIPYDESLVSSAGLSEEDVRFMHYNGRVWEDATISLNTTANTVTGRVDGFSPVVAAAIDDGTFDSSYFALHPISLMSLKDTRVSVGSVSAEDQVPSGQPITISAELANHQRQVQPFVYIVEILSPDGVVDSLFVDTGQLGRGETTTISAKWDTDNRQELGDYEARVLVLSSIDEPEILAELESVQFTLVGP